PEFAFFRQNTRTLSAVLALNMSRVSIEGENNQVEAQFVTTNYFSELGAAPMLGRTILPRDEDPEAGPVIFLAHGFWKRHFGGEPAVIGRTIRVNDRVATVIGVAPAAFGGLSMSTPAFWAPIHAQPHFAPGSRLLTDFSAEGGGVQM